VPVVAQR